MIDRGQRSRKRSTRYFGDDWDNKEDSDDHQARVNNDDGRATSATLASKDCAVVTPKDVPRKKNTRYFGDDWDNKEDSDEHQSPLKHHQDRSLARFPKKRAVVHQIGRDAIAGRKQPEKEPKRVIR